MYALVLEQRPNIVEDRPVVLRRTSVFGSKIRLIVCCMMLACLLFGCSYASVGHLQRQPWVLNTPQELEMRFWTFSFIAESSEGHYVLKGFAQPRTEALPEGLTWIDDLWLAAYLSDDRGRVLAQDLQVFSALPLQAGQGGVTFSFTLKPDQLSKSAPLEVTFGYNMTLTPHKDYMVTDAPKKPADDKTNVFFAHEGALTKI